MGDQVILLLLIAILLPYIVEGATVSCGTSKFTKSSGYITSPGFPNRYPQSKYCIYSIKVASGNRIELTWQKFDIPGYMPDCTRDDGSYVAVYIGCTSSFLVSKFCSTNAGKPHTIFSRDNCMKIIFSAEGKTGNGFSAFYKSVSALTPAASGKCKEDQEINYVDQGVIMSQNWPLAYPDIDECSWEIKTSSNKVVKLNFMDFDVYSISIYCQYGANDYVKIKGKDSRFTSSENKRYFCQAKKPFSLNTRYYRLEIDFKVKSIPVRHTRGFAVGFITYTPVGYSSSTWRLSTGAIAAVIIGVIAVVLCIVCGCRWLKRRQADQGTSHFTVIGRPRAKEPDYGTQIPSSAPPPYSGPTDSAYQGYPAYQGPPPVAATPYVPTSASGYGPPYQATAPYAAPSMATPGGMGPQSSEKQPLYPGPSAPTSYAPGDHQTAPYPPVTTVPYSSAASAPYPPAPSGAPPPY